MNHWHSIGFSELNTHGESYSYIRINLVLGVISWKLGPRRVHGSSTSLRARIWLGDLSGAQTTLHRGRSQKRRGVGLDSSVLVGQTSMAGVAVAGCPWWDRGVTCLSWTFQARWGRPSRQDLGLRGVMLPV